MPGDNRPTELLGSSSNTAHPGLLLRRRFKCFRSTLCRCHVHAWCASRRTQAGVDGGLRRLKPTPTTQHTNSAFSRLSDRTTASQVLYLVVIAHLQSIKSTSHTSRHILASPGQPRTRRATTPGESDTLPNRSPCGPYVHSRHESMHNNSGSHMLPPDAVAGLHHLLHSFSGHKRGRAPKNNEKIPDATWRWTRNRFKPLNYQLVALLQCSPISIAGCQVCRRAVEFAMAFAISSGSVAVAE